MLEIVAIQPPSTDEGAIQKPVKPQSNTPKSQSKPKPQRKAKKPRQLLIGNGLHSWRATVIAKAIVRQSKPGKPDRITFELSDGTYLKLRRSFRLNAKFWAAVEVGNYYRLRLYPRTKNKSPKIATGEVFSCKPSDRESFHSQTEEWVLVGFRGKGAVIVERSIHAIKKGTVPKRTAIVVDGLDTRTIEKDCYFFPVGRKGDILTLMGDPVPETMETALAREPWREAPKTILSLV